jgi:glycosyltransferase involved in cell wall biosynthesis
VLTHLVQDPVLRREMGARARSTIERGYSLAVVADKYQSLLTDLARL